MIDMNACVSMSYLNIPDELNVIQFYVEYSIMPIGDTTLIFSLFQMMIISTISLHICYYGMVTWMHQPCWLVILIIKREMEQLLIYLYW